MCIVVDTDTFSSVFNRDNAQHEDFKPVLDWIMRDVGKLVLGGTTYRQQIGISRRFLRIINLLSQKRKVVWVNDRAVDNYERRLKRQVPNPDFDDPHLIAIISVSRCCLICSNDQRAYPFIKNHRLYPRHVQPPRIYHGLRQRPLLSRNNMADCCLPCDRLGRRIADQLMADGHEAAAN